MPDHSWLPSHMFNNSSIIPVRLHKASTTARSFMHTPSTTRAYRYHPPKQANTKAAHMIVNTHCYGKPAFSKPCMHLCVHFNHELWVTVRCEASGVSEATTTVAEVSEASKATCNR